MFELTRCQKSYTGNILYFFLLILPFKQETQLEKDLVQVLRRRSDTLPIPTTVSLLSSSTSFLLATTSPGLMMLYHQSSWGPSGSSHTTTSSMIARCETFVNTVKPLMKDDVVPLVTYILNLFYFAFNNNIFYTFFLKYCYYLATVKQW